MKGLVTMEGEGEKVILKGWLCRGIKRDRQEQ
jgi:hypothetical protein